MQEFHFVLNLPDADHQTPLQLLNHAVRYWAQYGPVHGINTEYPHVIGITPKLWQRLCVENPTLARNELNQPSYRVFNLEVFPINATPEQIRLIPMKK